MSLPRLSLILSLVQTKHNKAQVKFPRLNCGRAVRIPADAIERFIERNTVPANEEGLKAPVPIRLPKIHRAPDEFDELPDELPDPSLGWIQNPERIDRSRGREVMRPGSAGVVIAISEVVCQASQ